MRFPVVEDKDEDEEEQFFDTREDLSSVSDSCPISPATCNLSPTGNFISLVSPASLVSPTQFKVWIATPKSIHDRRNEFRKWMNLTPTCSPRPVTPNCSALPVSVDPNNNASKVGKLETGTDKITSNSRPLPTSSDSESCSSMSRGSSIHSYSSEDGVLGESFVYRVKNLGDSNNSVSDELEKDGNLRRLHEVGSSQMLTLDDVHKSMGRSSFIHRYMSREDNGSYRSSTSSLSSEESVGSRKTRWLKKLGVVACVVDREGEEGSSRSSESSWHAAKRAHRVKVHSNRKQFKELSAVFMEQDVKAHDGAIWIMKFSPDGRYLATGGEDGIVRVWHVTESDRTGEEDILEKDAFSVSFTASHKSKLASIYILMKNKIKRKDTTITSAESAFVAIPPKVFRISEEPLHEFHGHAGDVLDLSWSKDKYLISSSLDKTVRLWQVGRDHCIRVFSHNDYVTCVQFNPTEENFFISGSIDGKVRIWDISKCLVIDYIDIREIVTAVCYQSDAKEVVVGSITGRCRFYSISDNHLQLENDVSLQGKKKSTSKRITGFQFSPSNPQKLMATCADSQIRILDRHKVVQKYKGFHNSGSLISASFTSDGKHIITPSEDSHVYVWNLMNKYASINHMEVSRSYERFSSNEATVAIPWHGLESLNHVQITSASLTSQYETFRDSDDTPDDHLRAGWPELLERSHTLSSSGSSTSNLGAVAEALPRTSATWPTERLTSSSTRNTGPALLKSRSCHDTVAPHSWGQVIVTAGLDGRIRSFQNYGFPVHT